MRASEGGREEHAGVGWVLVGWWVLWLDRLRLACWCGALVWSGGVHRSQGQGPGEQSLRSQLAAASGEAGPVPGAQSQPGEGPGWHLCGCLEQITSLSGLWFRFRKDLSTAGSPTRATVPGVRLNVSVNVTVAQVPSHT